MSIIKKNSKKESGIWTTLLRVIVAIATALLGVLGGTEVYGMLDQ